MDKLTLVYNPKSGRIYRENILERLNSEAELNGFEVDNISLFDFLENNYEEFLVDSRALIVVGGDGTINSVVNYLVKFDIKHPPIVIYPGGTSNDFAKLWWSEGKCSQEKVIRSIVENNVYEVDLGEVNGEYFINVVGMGMFMDVASNTSVDKKQKWGFLAYLDYGLRNLYNAKYRPFDILFKHGNNKEEIKCYLIFVLNSKGAGGLRNLVPDASIDDGYLDVVIVKGFDNSILNIRGFDYSVFGLYPKILIGNHLDDERVLHYRLKKFSIESNDEIDITVDGEEGGKFPLEFNTENKKISLYHL